MLRGKWTLAVKPLFGAALLGTVVVWIAGNEQVVARMSAAALTYSTLISSLTVGMNALILRQSVRYYGVTLSRENALRLSALGSLANGLGGLPFGTALKYTLLYRNGGVTAAEIAVGFAVFAVAISGWLFLYTCVTAQLITLTVNIAPLLPLIFAFGIVILLLVLRWIRGHRRLYPLFRPFLQPSNIRRVLLISFTAATTFVANYSMVGYVMYPDISTTSMAFLAAAGTLISLGSTVQSVGGITELSLGLSSVAAGLDAITGASLALVLRISAILASAAMLAGLLLRATLVKK